MKLEVTQENLNKALSMISRIVGIRSTLPILNNVLLATEKGRLKLSATDLEIGVMTWVGAKIDQEGTFTVPARLFNDFVSSAQEKTISLEIKESTLQISIGQTEAQIKGLPADEFPLIPEVKKEPFLALPPLLLKEVLKKVIVAAAVDETRPALTGILLWKQGGLLRLVATDSYRLTEAKLNLGQKADKTETKIIVPQRAISELVRLLEGADEEVSVAVSENQVLFRTPTFVLVSRLIEGEFPNYVDIIPSQGITTANVSSEEFLRSIKTASLFAREVGNHITLSVVPPDSLEIKAASPQLGENRSSLLAQTTGEKVSIAFNARFLQDAIGSIGGKTITMTFSGKTSPAVFRGERKEDFLHLVMPLRLE